MMCQAGQAVRRRRGTACITCPAGKFSHNPAFECDDTCGAGHQIRRRRATSCTACIQGHWSPDSGDCSMCGPGNSARRRRADKCVECSMGWFSDGMANEDCASCGPGLSARRRRADKCSECPAGYWSAAASDACLECKGEVRRRRANACTDCPPLHSKPANSDDCVSTTTTTTLTLYEILNVFDNSSLAIDGNSSSCSRGVWRILRVSDQAVTLQTDEGEPRGWGFFGHIGRSLIIADFGGPSFTWQLLDLGNSTYIVQNTVEDNRGRSYLTVSAADEVTLEREPQGLRSQWGIVNPP